MIVYYVVILKSFPIHRYLDLCLTQNIFFPCSGIHVDSPPTTPTLTTSYAHGTTNASLVHTTVGETLLRTVERWPDREAMAFLEGGVRKTFAEFQQEVSLFLKVYCRCYSEPQQMKVNSTIIATSVLFFSVFTTEVRCKIILVHGQIYEKITG